MSPTPGVSPGYGTVTAQHVRVQRIEIDDVPVFTAPGPDRITAALMFGVGLRDETFATVGVTHLIEHLVMGSLPKSHLQCNAMVTTDATIFYATGRPDAVKAFLETICAALTDLPTERMDTEVGVLQAENCAGSHPTVAALFGARFGLRGPGLTVAAGGAGPEFLSEDVVRAHARRWFVRENAALWCQGRLPDGLRLLLPGGVRPTRPVPEPSVQYGPVWISGPVHDGAGLLVAGPPRDPALAVGIHVLQERLTDIARHARGLSYSTGVEFVDTAADRRETALFVDAREGQAGEVARILWEQFWGLCEQGPTPEEIAHVLAGLEEELDEDSDEFVGGELSGAAFGELSEVPFRSTAEALDAWRTVTPDAVAAALRAGRDGAILMVPEGVTLLSAVGHADRRFFCGVVPVAPRGVEFRPSILKRALSRSARVALIVTEAGLAHRDDDGDVHVIAWTDIDAVLPHDEGEGFTVVGRNLCLIHVFADGYGRQACQAVRSRIPADRWLMERSPAVPSAADEVPVG